MQSFFMSNDLNQDCGTAAHRKVGGGLAGAWQGSVAAEAAATVTLLCCGPALSGAFSSTVSATN
jgi:hypothetical protein